MTNGLKLTADEWRYLHEKHSADPEPVSYPSQEELDYLTAARTAATAKAEMKKRHSGLDIDSIKPGMTKEETERVRQAILTTGWGGPKLVR
jgi:hypothetical protein